MTYKIDFSSNKWNKTKEISYSQKTQEFFYNKWHYNYLFALWLSRLFTFFRFILHEWVEERFFFLSFFLSFFPSLQNCKTKTRELTCWSFFRRGKRKQNYYRKVSHNKIEQLPQHNEWSFCIQHKNQLCLTSDLCNVNYITALKLCTFYPRSFNLSLNTND